MRALLPCLILAAVGALIVQTSLGTSTPAQIRVGPWSFVIGRSAQEPAPGQRTSVISSEGWEGLVLVHEGQHRSGAPVPACEAEFALDLDLGEIEGILESLHTTPAAGVSIPPAAPAIRADLELFRELYRVETLWPRALPDPSTVS